MDNVPVHVNHGAAAAEPTGRRGKGRRIIKKRLAIVSLGVVIAVALVVLVVLTIYRSNVGSQINTNEYQAVFFTNGQVYFGKLQIINNNYLKLSNIYYLQASSDTTDEKNIQKSTDVTSNDISLVKLGQEIHGPEDSMIINNDQVLFFENIKVDGKVSQAITTYISQQKK